jgi:mannose-6-phosphate isomerase-like protein (cupin superfamily)
MFSSARAEVIHLTLNPGDKMDPHVQPFDVIFFIIEGEGILETGEQKIMAKKNTCIWMEAGAQRSWYNPGRSELKILVYKDLK